MMELWWLVTGACRIRLTGADLNRTLRELTRQGIKLERLDFASELTVECTIARSQWKQVRNRQDVKAELLKTWGAVEFWRLCRKNPLVTVVSAMLILATLWVPSRLLFFRVEGNDTIPSDLILEYAAQCGVSFGASRRELRSEQVKNKLLEALPQLRWVGVNTQGCVATIQVEERQGEELQPEALPGNLVALRDAVVDSISVTAGQTLCTVGQAVREGQILVSGVQDLGICTRVEAAQGEIFGRTQRIAQAVLPVQRQSIGAQTGVQRKFSLIFGKNRINLHSDSGISQGSCGKMTRETQWVLPGGWTLPVWLVEEIYTYCETGVTERPAWVAETQLQTAAQRQTLDAMAAGEILQGRSQLQWDDECYVLSASYDCRELIGVQRSGSN